MWWQQMPAKLRAAFDVADAPPLRHALRDP